MNKVKHIDNTLLNHAYECLFDMYIAGVWERDVLTTVFQKDRKRAEIFNWLRGVIDEANAPFIKRSAAAAEQEVNKLFQENPFLRALAGTLSSARQFSVEFEIYELAERFASDVNLFRDLSEWIYEALLPRLPYLRSDSRWWGRITALNDIRDTIELWSYGMFASEDSDVRVRAIKKADFVVRWLQLFLEAGMLPDRISKNAFEKWRQKKRGRS